MKLTEKIKKLFLEAINEHPFSIILFFIGCVMWSISSGFDYSSEKVNYLELVMLIFFGASLGTLLSEAIHLYRKDFEGYNLKAPVNIAIYGGITLISALCVIPQWLLNNVESWMDKCGDALDGYASLTMYIAIFVIVTICTLTIYFFYKKSGESFETYVAKAFCGCMKAELLYLIVALGVLLVLAIFDTLIFSGNNFDLIEHVEIIVIGLVQFPCLIIGLTKTEEPLGKFAKGILTYVFTSLTAIAFLIIYIYIFKIIFSLDLPSNEVFEILTWLFFFGVIIWTMAQGCEDENLQKFFRLFPFLFVPCIILQIICVAMRISEYGFTINRYFGLALIIFEIIYYVIYTIKFIRKKDIVSNMLFVIIAAAFIVFFVPGLSAESAITNSQKQAINRYLELGNKSNKDVKLRANSAYHTISNSGGLAGYNYLYKTLSKEELEKVIALSNSYGESYDSTTDEYINDVSNDSDTGVIEINVTADNNSSSINLDGYTQLFYPTLVNDQIYLDENSGIDNLEAIMVEMRGEELGTVDLKDTIYKLADLSRESNTYNGPEFDEVISQPIDLSAGGKFIVTNIGIYGTYDNSTKEYRFESISIDGFVLK